MEPMLEVLMLSTVINAEQYAQCDLESKTVES